MQQECYFRFYASAYRRAQIGLKGCFRSLKEENEHHET